MSRRQRKRGGAVNNLGGLTCATQRLPSPLFLGGGRGVVPFVIGVASGGTMGLLCLTGDVDLRRIVRCDGYIASGSDGVTLRWWRVTVRAAFG